MNSYSVTFDYSQYLVQHLMNDPEGKKTTICYCLEHNVQQDAARKTLKLHYHRIQQHVWQIGHYLMGNTHNLHIGFIIKVCQLIH